MHELVLVLSDFYVSQETPDRELPAGVTLPGLQQVTRFGTRSKIPNGWRPWLSRWLTGADAGAPATVAAAALPPVPWSTAAPAFTAWVATPMHLVAGMTSVHVDRRSILRLDAADQQTIAADFQHVFHDSGFHLQPLEAGDFLLLGPEMPTAEMEEPARAVGASMAHQAGATPALRKLGAEIEMWLHDHAINDTRRRRGEQPVTALWLWGGGTIRSSGVCSGNRDSPTSTTARADASDPGTPILAGAAGNIRGALPPSAAASASSDIAFGRDSYLQGLWPNVAPLPQQLTDVFSYPQAQRAALVIEMGLMLHSNPKWTFFEAVVDIDRRFIAPAVEALNAGQYDRLIVLANDYELRLRASDRFKFWRRMPAGLSGLQ